jgi:serine phosphatase RsbU (regulator of sigma subunit)
MKNLNSIMSNDLFSTNCFITMVLARYTPTSRQIVYANAGHIYPIVWSHRLVVQQQTEPDREDSASSPNSVTVEPNYLKVRGVPLGILTEWKASAGILSLEAGEIFLLTSDGITEATVTKLMGSKHNKQQSTSSMLNQSGLWQLLLQESAPFDLTNLLAHIRECTNNVQEDDQTILSLEVL